MKVTQLPPKVNGTREEYRVGFRLARGPPAIGKWDWNGPTCNNRTPEDRGFPYREPPILRPRAH